MSVIERIYPPIPAQAQTGLLMFGAYFKGANDGTFLHQAGLRCTVVDNNRELLEQMRPEYPDTWRFICQDSWDYAYHQRALLRKWDVVSVDPSLPEEPRTIQTRHLFRDLANMMTVIGCRTSQTLLFDDGWEHMPGRPIGDNQPWSWMIAHEDSALAT